jgi:N-acyl homoserine lactone hydrolase
VSVATADRLIALPGAVLAFNASLMGGPDVMLEMPVPTFLIEHPKGLVLFDTGCNLRVVEEGAAYLGEIGKMVTVRFSRDDVVDMQLKRHGYQPSQVKYVVLSHGHFDHAGGLALFPDAQFFAMKGELPNALWPEGDGLGFVFDDIAPARNFKWTQPAGDLDLFDDGSLVMLKTPGHTPGECSLVVRLKSQTVVLTGDTLHTRSQLQTLAPLSGDYDPAQATESIKRLAAMERGGQARLWINHDAGDWSNYPHELQ